MIAKNLLVTVFASVTLFAQGSLTPPSGPAPSMKTLGQIEPRVAIEKLPFKIISSGAYYLTANLVAPAGGNGITIDASQVTLDLNGFVLTGAVDNEAAIAVVTGRSDVAIRNGVINSAGSGIEGTGASRMQIESVRVTQCMGSGISVGADSTINNCVAAENLSTGFHLGTGGVIANSQAMGNGANGIDTDAKSTVRDCTAARNAQAGVAVGDYARVAGVTATDNAGAGITGGLGVHFTDCTANANKQHGLNAGRLAFVTRANTSGNALAGVNVTDGASILDSASSGNGLAGILAGDSAQVANCKVDSNTGFGIGVLKSSTVRDCAAQRNGNDGISVTDQCLVLRNNATGNSNLRGSAGIHVKGTDNSVQENIAIANDRGIVLDAEGNLVFKNSVTNNSLNFATAGDQFIGPVLNTFDGVSAVNPMSNFIY